MLSLNDTLKLASLGSSKLFNLLKTNDIKISNKVLNYSIKQVVVTHILASDDCFELRHDLDKIKAFTLSQLVDYLKANYVQVSVEDILINLWTVVVNNLNRLEISETSLTELITKTDYEYETVESLVQESRKTFFDGMNEIDGQDFLEAKKAYKLYATNSFLISELERLDVAIPRRVTKKEFLQRVLDALGANAKEYEKTLINYSFDELVEFATVHSLGLNTELSQDDLIRLLVNYYADNTCLVTPIDYDIIKNLDYNKDDFQTIKSQPLTSDNEELLQSISDVLSNEGDEIDAILSELDLDIADEEEDSEVSEVSEVKEEPKVTEPIKEEKEEEEDASYNLTGLFDDALINSVLNDDVEPEVKEEKVNEIKVEKEVKEDIPVLIEKDDETVDLENVLKSLELDNKKTKKEKAKNNKVLIILLLIWLLVMIALVAIRII